MNVSLLFLQFIFVYLLIPAALDPSSSTSQDKSPLVLDGAEYVQQKIDNGETVIILEGDVRWSRGSNHLRCDRAKYFEERDLLYLSRDVRLVEVDRRVHADSILYIGGKDLAIAMGNVVLETGDGEVVVRSDSIEYDLGKRESWAFKRPELELSGGDDGEKKSEQVRILRDHLHMLEEDYLAIQGEVDISGDSLRGEADSLNYDLESDRIVLLGSPWIEIGSYRLEGETLELQVPGRVLRRGISRGSSRGEESTDTGEDFTNWIEADSIFLSFRDNRIDSLLAVRNARSYYRVTREEGVEENYVTGEEILLVWEDRELDIIRVKGRGEGVYLKEEEEKGARVQEENLEENPDQEGE